MKNKINEAIKDINNNFKKYKNKIKSILCFILTDDEISVVRTGSKVNQAGLLQVAEERRIQQDNLDMAMNFIKNKQENK